MSNERESPPHPERVPTRQKPPTHEDLPREEFQQHEQLKPQEELALEEFPTREEFPFEAPPPNEELPADDRPAHALGEPRSTTHFGSDPPPAPSSRPRIRGNVVLFLITLSCSVYWGFLQYQQFYDTEPTDSFTLNPLAAPDALLGGLPFGLAVIAFLLAHEMGHYLACRHYGIAASLPYFIPFPPPFLYFFVPPPPGTMGAVIRIRGVITSRKALFDIAVAGPIAGWVTALPILAYGLSQSRVLDRVDVQMTGFYINLGEPLIWPLLSSTFGPDRSPSQELLVHPLAFVGWFALLVTAMNLLPLGQLDGGHLTYAFLPRWHRAISIGVLAFMLYAGFMYFPGWLFFAGVVSVLIYLSGGLQHPQPMKKDRSLGPVRIALGLLAVVIFVTSFMLVPVTIPPIFR